MAHLEIIEGFQPGQKIPLRGTITIGRSPGNILCLPDSRASRKHARIHEENGQWLVEDLGSSNGTYLAGERLQPDAPVAMRHGDEVILCSTRFKFFLDETETSPPSSISAVVTEEEMSAPEVSLTLDASVNQLEISDAEKQSEKGLQDAIRRLQAMVRVSVDLGGVSNRDALLSKVMERIFEVFPAADRAFVLLRHPATGEMLPAAGSHRDPENAKDKADTFPISRTIVKTVTEKRQSLLSSDAMSDQRFGAQQSILNLQIRSMMCAPFLCQGEILGIISVDTMSSLQAFDENDLSILTGIASQAAISLKNTQLYEQVEEEAEKRALLSRYMSPDIVGGVLDGTIPLELGGKKAYGTVFFCDILGFTQMSEAMDAVAVIDRLNRCFHLTTEVITRNQGTIHKFGGDAIMAFWNVMFDDPAHEQNALLAGLEMQIGVWLFDLELRGEGHPPVYLGIGCNSGSFAAGNIGGEGVMEYTIIGDNVNLAQRVESKAGRWQVLASENTFSSVRENTAAIVLPEVQLKGKSLPIRLYSIRAVQKPDGRIRLAIPVRILGRDRKPVGFGMLTEATDNEVELMTGTDLELEGDANDRVFTRDTRANPVLILEMVFPELSVPRHLVAIVHSVETRQSPTAHRLVRLGNLQASDDTLQLLRPGSVITSDRSWDQMQRQ